MLFCESDEMKPDYVTVKRTLTTEVIIKLLIVFLLLLPFSLLCLLDLSPSPAEGGGTPVCQSRVPTSPPFRHPELCHTHQTDPQHSPNPPSGPEHAARTEEREARGVCAALRLSPAGAVCGGQERSGRVWVWVCHVLHL